MRSSFGVARLHLFGTVPCDAQQDFLPVAQLYRGGSLIVAGPAFKRPLRDRPIL